MRLKMDLSELDELGDLTENNRQPIGRISRIGCHDNPAASTRHVASSGG
jgi:hypothetical protein